MERRDGAGRFQYSFDSLGELTDDGQGTPILTLDVELNLQGLVQVGLTGPAE